MEINSLFEQNDSILLWGQFSSNWSIDSTQPYSKSGSFFYEVEKIIMKFIWACKPRVAKAMFKKKRLENWYYLIMLRMLPLGNIYLELM